MKKIALLAAGALATGLSFSIPSQAQQVRHFQPIFSVPVIHFKGGGVRVIKKSGFKRRHGIHNTTIKRRNTNRGFNRNFHPNRTSRFDSQGFSNPNIGR